jgi:hypothetical protein
MYGSCCSASKPRWHLPLAKWTHKLIILWNRSDILENCIKIPQMILPAKNK